MGYKARFSSMWGSSKCKPSPVSCRAEKAVNQGQFRILLKSGIDSKGFQAMPVGWWCWWLCMLARFQDSARRETMALYCRFRGAPPILSPFPSLLSSSAALSGHLVAVCWVAWSPAPRLLACLPLLLSSLPWLVCPLWLALVLPSVVLDSIRRASGSPGLPPSPLPSVLVLPALSGAGSPVRPGAAPGLLGGLVSGYWLWCWWNGRMHG